jgi:hypothetical protein
LGAHGGGRPSAPRASDSRAARTATATARRAGAAARGRAPACLPGTAASAQARPQLSSAGRCGNEQGPPCARHFSLGVPGPWHDGETGLLLVPYQGHP